MIIKIKIKDKIYRVKDCKGAASIRGLMFDPLEDKDGALIYANNVWMPFCKPLKLFFLDENMKVTSIQDAVPMTLDPKTWNVYRDEKAKYCLEIKMHPAGIEPAS